MVAPATVPAVLDADLSGVRILVVDDDPDGREMLTHMLESWGARVRAAGSADEALAALSEERPELLISDIGMPRVDGYELMRQDPRPARACRRRSGGDRADCVRARRRRSQGAAGRIRRSPAEAGRSVAALRDDQPRARHRRAPAGHEDGCATDSGVVARRQRPEPPTTTVSQRKGSGTH
jgi:hypothetical protein